MILKGRSRGHGSQLARYLFNVKNEEVRVLDIRGTCASELTKDGLIDALKEFDEYGLLTKGSKTIFHLAIAPSDFDRMDATRWQYAVAKAERELGLEGQPRAVVSHVYEGKEHLHVAWSRVDLETHKLKSDSFTNLKLCNAARDIEIELGLSRLPDMHRGHDQARKLTDELKHKQEDDARRKQEQRQRKKPPELTPFPKPAFADKLAMDIERSNPRRILPKPKNIDRIEKKIAIEDKRKEKQRDREKQKFAEEASKRTTQELKRTIATAWYQSDNGEEFKQRLERQNFRLVRGDRGAIVMDAEGNTFSPARYLEDAKVKDVNEKCADVLSELQSVDQARSHGKDTLLSPRKAAKMVRMKLKLEISNDPMQQPRASYEAEEYDP